MTKQPSLAFISEPSCGAKYKHLDHQGSAVFRVSCNHSSPRNRLGLQRKGFLLELVGFPKMKPNTRAMQLKITRPARHQITRWVLWDVFLYTVNLCCSHWLTNKAALAYSRAEWSQAGKSKRDIERRKAGSGDVNPPLKEQQEAHSPVTPLPHGNT